MLITDVIVGAPFENGGSGAAYVYHGGATGLVDHYAQKLTPAQLRLPALRGFAHSFASRIDIDNNRYPGNTAIGVFLMWWCLRSATFYGADILSTSIGTGTTSGPEVVNR